MAGRQILDQALIAANKAIKLYQSKKRESIVLNLTFWKAYDHVDWNFLDSVDEERFWLQVQDMIVGVGQKCEVFYLHQ